MHWFFFLNDTATTEIYSVPRHAALPICLAYLGLWSQGLMFIGPLLILMGMGLAYLSRGQFGFVKDA